MSVVAEPTLDSAELRRLLRAVDPAVLLVPSRLLRRVIKRDRKLAIVGLRVPHRKSYVIGRDALLALVDRNELEIEPDRELPDTVLLLERPEPVDLAAAPRGVILVDYWRLLFHARVHATIAARRPTDTHVRETIHCIGEVEFDELRTVLRQEKLLLPPRDDRTVLEEFAAVFLELLNFAPAALPRFFPAIDDAEFVEHLLGHDVDGPGLLAATRPAGAPDPVAASQADRDNGSAEPSAPLAALGWRRNVRLSERYYEHLMARGDRAMTNGNTVRAAISRARAAAVAPRRLAGQALARATAEIDRLVRRLQPILRFDAAEAEAWRGALAALLPGATTGLWPAEARLLYDLQRVCVAHERPVEEPRLAEWVYAHFRGSLLRPLPDQPLVLTVKHLRKAAGRLPAVRVPDAARPGLVQLLHRALEAAEKQLRDRLHPLIANVLTEVNLRPTNLPERVARDKLIEELLDGVTARGYLTMGELRDALSRNQLKLPDLTGPGEWFGGDPLLRANRNLAERAPGIYRRGEIYLRWLQRLSAAAFGTRTGRLLTLHLLVPFGGAFLAIEGPMQVGHEIAKLYRFVHRLIFGGEAEHASGHHHAPFPLAPWSVLLLGGVFFWMLLHVPSVRRVAMQAVGLIGRGLRALVIDLPAAVLSWPALQQVIESRTLRFIVRYVLKPIPPALVAWITLVDWGLYPEQAAVGAGGVFLATVLFLASRFGRDFEEAATDWAARRWEYLRDFLPGLFRLIAEVFKRFLEAIDRGLYAVDEWLRFRHGESRFTKIWKTTAGLVWGGIAYFLRFMLILFIEPQINPIKHFPVVTVSHKLLLPMIPSFAAVLVQAFGVGEWEAGLIATIIIGKIPGVFGFLVWEFKENWRLYAANRPRTLRPVMVGHHGETLPRLLRPGFHSGTVPKLFARLRKALRRSRADGDSRPARRYEDTLHHVEEAVRDFAERELVALVNGSRRWRSGPVHVAKVEAATNCLRLELACPKLGGGDLQLRFDEQSGWLLAQVAEPGWLPTDAEQAAVFALSLTGFYQEAGVDLIREQIEACLAPLSCQYDITDEGLVVWPDGDSATRVVYDVNEEPEMRPRVVAGSSREDLPVLRSYDLVFHHRRVGWMTWIDAWDVEDTGAQPPKPLLPGARVLPPTTDSASCG
jgi:hypothetical protein